MKINCRQMTMKLIIVDDEKLARDVLKSFLSELDDIEIIGEYSDGFQALKAINTLKPDLVCLDIQMPKLTGFEMLELLESTPNIIFITAYNDYAIKAFECNAIDYLLKPFSKDRFIMAIEKARERLSNNLASTQVTKLNNYNDEHSTELNRIVVKWKNKIHVIAVSNINYIEAQDDYVMIYTKDSKFLKQKTMKYFQYNLPQQDFCRIHRSYIVRIDQISQIESYEKDSWLVFLKAGEKLKLSRSGYKLLKQRLDI